MANTRPLLASTIYAEMRHAIGGTSDLRPQDLLNDVLSEVTSMHEWDFLARGEAFVDLRSSVSISNWSWTASSKTLTDPGAGGLLASYTYYPTDLVHVSAGGTTGYYSVASKVSSDALTLAESLSATDLTGIGGTLRPRCHALPADFGSLIDAGFVDNTSYLNPSSRTSVARTQRNSIVQNLAYQGAVEWADQNTPMLRIDPVPVSAAKSAISIVYRRRLAVIGGDGEEINAPTYMHRLIKDVSRALVRGLEMPETYGEFHQQLDALKRSSLFMDAVRSDGGSQTDLGRVNGSGHASRSLDQTYSFPPSTISVTGP